MKILVTGCAGFIGSSLTDSLLNQGHTVFGVDCFTDYYPRYIKEKNLRSAKQSPNFTLIEKNINFMDDFPLVDIVFHEAAQAGVRGSWGKSFESYVHNNISATQHLLEYYKEKGLKKFVYASSSSIYGDAPLPMSEDTIPGPLSPYGVTKLAGEHLCTLYSKNYNVPTVSLRYFTVYGPRQRPDMAINIFLRSIDAGDEIKIFGDGKQSRDFTYISDVVDANIKAAMSNVEGKVLNIGGGSRISIIDLIKIIEDCSAKTANIQHEGKQQGDARDTMASNSQARDLIKWTPKVGIKEGIKKYTEWYYSTRSTL